MSVATHEGLAEALTDVRRAYRLLWAFQRRMLDYNRCIRDRLGFEHYNMYYYGDRPNSDPEKKWMWDWLPGALVGFESVRRIADVSSYPNRDWTNHLKAGDAALLVMVESDSEFRTARATGKGEPNPLKFSDVKTAKSRLHLRLVVNQVDRDEKLNWHYQVLSTVKSWPEAGQMVDHPKVKGIVLYGEAYDLAELGDEEVVLAACDQFADNVSKKLGVKLGNQSEDDEATEPGLVA